MEDRWFATTTVDKLTRDMLQIAFGLGETTKEPERTSLKKNAFGIKINATTMYSINCKYT